MSKYFTVKEAKSYVDIIDTYKVTGQHEDVLFSSCREIIRLNEELAHLREEAGQKIDSLHEVIEMLKEEGSRLREQARWIPMTQPPTHEHPVILAQLDNDWIQAVIWAVTGWYHIEAKKWIYPIGRSGEYDHYMDCLIDNRKSQPPEVE